MINKKVLAMAGLIASIALTSCGGGSARSSPATAIEERTVFFIRTASSFG
jgi:hypothetical protein